MRQGRLQLELIRPAARPLRPWSRRALLAAGLLAFALGSGARAENEPVLDAADLVEVGSIALHVPNTPITP